MVLVCECALQVCECALLPKYCSSISMTSQSPEKGKSSGKMPEMEGCLVINPVCEIHFYYTLLNPIIKINVKKKNLPTTSSSGWKKETLSPTGEEKTHNKSMSWNSHVTFLFMCFWPCRITPATSLPTGIKSLWIPTSPSSWNNREGPMKKSFICLIRNVAIWKFQMST